MKRENKKLATILLESESEKKRIEERNKQQCLDRANEIVTHVAYANLSKEEIDRVIDRIKIVEGKLSEDITHIEYSNMCDSDLEKVFALIDPIRGKFRA